MLKRVEIYVTSDVFYPQIFINEAPMILRTASHLMRPADTQVT